VTVGAARHWRLPGARSNQRPAPPPPRHLCPYPPQTVAGAEHVLAIVPAGVKRDAAAENPDTLVLRAPDSVEAGEMRKKLIQSATQMAAVAGLMKVGAGMMKAGAGLMKAGARVWSGGRAGGRARGGAAGMVIREGKTEDGAAWRWGGG
jgi:hypothetical protein